MSDEIVDIPTIVTEVPAEEPKSPASMTKDELASAINAESVIPSEPIEKPEIKPEAKPEEPDLQALMADLEKERLERERLSKKAEHQEKFLERLGREVGMHRRQNPEEINEKIKEISLIGLDDPNRAAFLFDNLKNEIAEQDRQQQEFGRFQVEEKNRGTVKGWVPEIETSLDDIAALVKEDTGNEETARNFKEGAFLQQPELLLNLHHRARLTKENVGLKAELEALRKENGELKKRPGQLLDEIERAANNKTITGKGGGGGNLPSYSGGSVRSMPMSELSKIAHGR